MTVTARMAATLNYDVTIPLTLTAGSAETGDYDETVTSVTIPTCPLSVYLDQNLNCTVSVRGPGTVTIETWEDLDADDETFTVAVGSPLPPEVPTDNPSSVEVTIRELRATLEASTRRPAEGRTAVLTATLNVPAPAGGVTATFFADGVGASPATAGLDYTLDPAHPSGAANATADIVIPEGLRRATATLRVVDDDEREGDEEIEIGVVTTPSTYAFPVDTLTIPANDGPASVRLEVEPNPVAEGGDVTVTAHLSEPAPAALAIPLVLLPGTAESGDHGTLAEIAVAAGARFGEGTIETYADEDADDETFTVRVGAMPSTLQAASPTSVEVTIEDVDRPEVWLEAEPNPVAEGDTVTVTALLSEPSEGAVTIPVRTVRGTSESGDHGTLSGIRIAAGEMTGEGRIPTFRDADGDRETFSVVLRGLPASMRAASPDSIEVTIEDYDEPAPEVWLEAYPNPVVEGDSVTVMAFVSLAFDRAVTIPVRTVRGTSESGDHGTLSGIRIAAGEAVGEGRIATVRDEDADDETFTVRVVGSLPSPLRAASPDGVEITIADDGGGSAPGAPRNLRVTAGDERLDLTWTAPSSGTPAYYEVEQREQGASGWTGGPTEPDYTDTVAAIEGLRNGTRYEVRVRGWKEQEASAWATGSGTPASDKGSNASLRGLTVSASAGENGTYRTLALTPSYRPSVTSYTTATAPATTTHLKLTPTAADANASIDVEGHEVASGSASPAIEVYHGTLIWVTVISEDRDAYTEYTVDVRIAETSGEAGRSAAPPADAALAVIGSLSPEHAAGALLDGWSIGEERADALDRLGNANGRYDLGDLLAWIERCRIGGARCGEPPGTTPPASEAALPGAVAAAAKRPERRVPGRRRMRRRRRPRTGVFAVLLAAGLWSCDGAGVVGVPSAADMPEPGYLTVEWTARAAGPAAAGALVEIDGPQVQEVRALGGLELYAGEEGRGPRRFVVAGDMRNGPALEFGVPDLREAGLYTVRVVEVAGADHRLLEPDEYWATVTN